MSVKHIRFKKKSQNYLNNVAVPANTNFSTFLELSCIKSKCFSSELHSCNLPRVSKTNLVFFNENWHSSSKINLWLLSSSWSTLPHLICRFYFLSFFHLLRHNFFTSKYLNTNIATLCWTERLMNDDDGKSCLLSVFTIHI